ncbi:PREDICTED: trimethyllysine dioxygenase, mitochondrial-like [Tinamus guttatus]|uniref:trimethyllysine dioxygenase, mitochondrial-like n=1 Tax=Tinamus guttatus TaxID=94827 RepID=UPI00052EA71F|nr:PREDICTED: trimethyllysine dioxygenase, mitochondrial-like [Tinamus guttatus]
MPKSATGASRHILLLLRGAAPVGGSCPGASRGRGDALLCSQDGRAALAFARCPGPVGAGLSAALAARQTAISWSRRPRGAVVNGELRRQVTPGVALVVPEAAPMPTPDLLRIRVKPRRFLHAMDSPFPQAETAPKAAAQGSGPGDVPRVAGFRERPRLEAPRSPQQLRYANTLMRLDFVWLRDHCRSASCYNSKTNQRSLDTASVDLAIKPQAVRVDETTLFSFAKGPDGHVTRYGLEWLVKNSYEGQKQQVMHPRILWNADIYQQAQIPSVDCRSFLETDEGLKEFLQNFLLYGIAFVENVTPTKEDTEVLAERISLIRETIYGRMWYFTSDFSRGDTAYTKLALDRHTDTTYFQEPCGIQVFHCLKHEGTGGRTLLVDGFYAAEQVLQQAPDQFELLSKVPLKHEYVENVGGCHNHMIGVGPVLNVYPWNNELYLIRYNNYDRAVINTVPHDVVRRWYTAHRTLTTELRRPENELWVKLKPGKALFIDNWRVLHGREAFTGYRQLCGCYLTRDDVLNTARLLGLQA